MPPKKATPTKQHTQKLLTDRKMRNKNVEFFDSVFEFSHPEQHGSMNSGQAAVRKNVKMGRKSCRSEI